MIIDDDNNDRLTPYYLKDEDTKDADLIGICQQMANAGSLEDSTSDNNNDSDSEDYDGAANSTHYNKNNTTSKKSKLKFNLDFNLYSSKERRDFIQQQDLSKLSPKDLEMCANYILYGKDADGTSTVDRKEVQIKTKFSSYSKKEPISLDALLESPTFDEGSLVQSTTIYKNPKPTIDREKLKDVPGFKELWEQIDKWQRIIDENSGKKEKTPDTPVLTKRQLYYLNHQLIELRKQQYYLKDSIFPTVAAKPNFGHYYPAPASLHLNYEVFPRGVVRNEHDVEFKEPRRDSKPAIAEDIEEQIQSLKKDNKYYFNFLEAEHVYQLIQSYWDIKAAIEKIPDSPLHNLLWTLDFYIEKANLSDQQRLIVEGKKQRLLNKEIGLRLEKELGITHQENYISTIWNKSVQLIVDAAALNYDEWLCKDYDKAWKKCNTCGKELLRDPRNFVRKKIATDGLTSNCKCCDKVKRMNYKR